MVGLMFGISSLASLITPFIPSVGAASLYDDAMQTSSTLDLRSSITGFLECPVQDITSSWQTYMTDSSKLYSTSGVNLSNFAANKASFENALDHGVWGVTKASLPTGGSGYMQYAIVWWAEHTSVTVDWSIANGTDQIAKVNGSNIRLQYIEPRASYGDTGSTKCDLTVDNSNPWLWTSNSVEISNEYGANLTVPGPRAGMATFFANVPANTINYPDDTHPNNYEGVSVPYFYQGATISGNVQCANTNNVISHVIIDTQSSIDGDALLTDDGVGGKNYRFFLWDSSPYSLVVVCDGDSFYGPTVDTNLYYHYNWACAPTSPGQNPNLRVCAAA